MSVEIVSAKDSRKAYADRKDQVLELLEYARQYYEQDGNHDKADVFGKLYRDLEYGEFSIVIVGEFSAGKSTLLNALMGKRILPSYSNETTAAVNFLRHLDKSSDGEQGKVFYHNGEQKIIEDASLETIMEYVSTKGDDVAKKVDHLDLYLDSDFLKDGVTLVDSPGLNGVADGHREITEAQILKSHASIFLFNSDHPGSKTDFEFLHDLQSKVKTILFVLNKIDEIKMDENETPETVIETLKRTYKEKFPEETTVPEIWPVAAYPALVARNEEPLKYHGKVNRTAEEKRELEEASRLGDFEDRLLSFLTCGEKAKQQLLAPVERVIAIALESRGEYGKEQELLENSVDTTEIDNQIAGIKDSMEGLEKQMENSRGDVVGRIGEALRDSMEGLSAQMSRLQERKLMEIDGFDDLDELVSYLQRFEKSFEQSVYRIALEQEEELRDKISNVIRMQFASQAGVIESGFIDKEADFQLSAPDSLNTDERIFEVGIREMSEKEEILEGKIKELEKEAEQAENDYYRARKAEKERNKLEMKIQYLQNSRETLESQALPPIERYQKSVPDKEYRGGILGGIGWLLFGGKNVMRPKQVTDSTEHDEAKKTREQRLEELERKKSETQQKLDRIEDVDAERAEHIRLKKSAEANAMREQLERLIKEHTQDIEAKYKREIKKIKRELRDYCDATTEELSRQVKKTLRNAEQGYIEIVLSTVEAGLRDALNDKKTRLELLEKQLEASEADRNARIEELKGKTEKINLLIANASDLQTNLSSLPVDQIKQETI